MRNRTRQFRVGLLVCGTGVLFSSLVMFIAGSALEAERHSHFIEFDENVKGMVVGSKVNFQGVPIGAVADIRFKFGKSLVEISIDPQKAVIQEVTTAHLDRLLVTGQVTVELEGYEKDAPTLPDRSFVRATSNAISQLAMSAPDVLARADRMIVEATKLMENVNRIMSETNLERVDRMLIDFEAATGDLQELVASSTRAFDRLAELQAGLLALAQEAQSMLGNNRHSFRTLLLSAGDALREIHGLARMLRLAPSSLVFGAEAQEISVPNAVPTRGDR